MQRRRAISHTNRNFVIAYILLVGLPLLGLVGVLRSGRALTAPFSIDGNWKLEAAAPTSTSSCNSLLSSISESPIAISQSGTALVIGLNGGRKTASGSLEGKTVRAQFRGMENLDVQCGGRALSLAATLDPLTQPRSMRGTLSVENCGACSVEFQASRQPRVQPGATH